MSVAIQWFENPAFDAPELKSPQPCIHGAGCVYTKKTADGKVVPGVCGFVHPGEEGRGRRLFPARTVTFEHPDGEDVVDQPACVRLIGGALYYERMRMRMPWQAFCAVRGIPFTANVPGVLREPVRRVPIGSPRVAATNNEQRKHEIVGKLVSLSAELSSLMGPAPVSAVATADQSWPVLGGGDSNYDECPPEMHGERVRMTPERQKLLVKESERFAASYRASQCLAGEPAPLTHAAVEAEVIAASNGYLGVVLPRPSWSLACESEDSPDCYDNCDECGKPVEDCPERGDHGDEKRWYAEQAMW